MPPAIASLEDLIAPLTAPEFLELLRRRSIKFHRGSGENRYGDLLTWRSLRSMIETGAVPAEALRITKDAAVIPPVFYLENGKMAGDKLDRLLSSGASLVIATLSPHVPALEALCASIGDRTAETIVAGAIATRGDGGALAYHYDEDDLFIVQVEGSKRWRVYGPPVQNPVAGMDASSKQQGEPVFDEVLRPGDFLFLPAGYWHQCANKRDLSLHLGIFFKPHTAYYAVKSLLAKLMTEEIFRRPLARLENSTDRTALEAEIKSRLIGQFESMLSSKPPLAEELSPGRGPAGAR
ncbi:MAG: cupin domain-containing protein [Reyranella sp.]|uniref:JmjC domain-containing protein n=1 Tax=Reyranella sp. TaxID=1929291 RepID=UPI00272FB668|nr:cupin domain-containing protein [Reyranella sp.]MDP1961375.1 cupin domain-containing protein [Reyranella sp.]MDP2373419.1 cupin domain-containing protein [Reyranella sp.]